MKKNLLKLRPALTLPAGGAEATMERNEVHIAIVDLPTIKQIADGEKTIESRFSKNRTKPFGKVEPEDMVLLKKSGGDIYGYFFVESVESLTGFDAEEVERKYNSQIRAGKEFWSKKRLSRFATLMRCKNPVMANSGVFFKRIGMDGWLYQPICDGRHIVCFSGQICAGKTTYAKALAKTFNARYIHFGTVIRQYAKARGYGDDRASMQKVDQIIMETLGAADLAAFAMASVGTEKADRSIVFDGVQHEGILEEIRNRYSEVKMIYVEASERERYKRYINQTGMNISLHDFKEINEMPVEREITHLKDGADYIIHSRAEERLNEAVHITNNIVAALLTGRRIAGR